MKLTYAQTAAYAAAAGFKGEDLVVAVAVARAESGLNTNAKNPGSSATGLWQIMQSVHVKAHPTWSTAYLLDPANNAHAAYTVFQQSGGHWTPWVVYTAQTYRLYMNAARRAVNAHRTTPIPRSSPGTQAPAPSLVGGDGAGSDVSPGAWLRVAMFIVGTILALFSLNTVLHMDRLIPAGRVLAVAKGLKK